MNGLELAGGGGESVRLWLVDRFWDGVVLVGVWLG